MTKYGLHQNQGTNNRFAPIPRNASRGRLAVSTIIGPIDRRAAIAEQRQITARIRTLAQARAAIPHILAQTPWLNQRGIIVPVTTSMSHLPQSGKDDIMKDTTGLPIQCSICMEPTIKVNEAVKTTCGAYNHVYHKKCLKQTVSHSRDSNLICPNCRCTNPPLLIYKHDYKHVI